MQAVYSPSTGQRIGEVQQTPISAVGDRVKAARLALPEWSRLARHRRSAVLQAAADRIRAESEQLAHLLCQESGKPLQQSRFEVGFAVDLLAANAAMIRWMRDRMIATEALPGTEDDLAWETRKPLGVVAAILPFNFPLELLVEKAGAALAMGNAVIVKLPEETPLSVLRMVQILHEAGVPENALIPVIGGREAGQELVRQPGLDAVSLTGSTAAGIAVSEACAPLLRKLHLELGGNDAAIVLEDADLDLAVPQFIFGRTLMNGQACASNKRLIVHRSRAAELAERLAVEIDRLRMGDAADPGTTLGPLISERAADRVVTQIREAVREGATLLRGEASRDRCFVGAHLLADVPATAAIARDEEIFGPVLPIIPVADEAEALKVANQSSFGLSGCVFTRDWQRGLRLAEAMECGGCVVNGTGNYRPFTVPFGGVKKSGLGREGLGYTLSEMSRSKYIVLRNFRQS